MICKDLHPDNLLLGSDGDLSLTFFSKWNLVDDILNKDAVEGFYVAPEMCGLVNYPISQASDFWSFGVLAYELLTMNVCILYFRVSWNCFNKSKFISDLMI